MKTKLNTPKEVLQHVLAYIKHTSYETFICLEITGVCNKNNIDTFMENTASSKILVDRNNRLFSDPDPVKVSISNGKINKILKKIEIEDIDGIAIGIYMLSKKMIGLLLKKIETYFIADNYNLSLYYAINDLVQEHPMTPVYCDGSSWCDVDTPKELEMLNTILQDQHYY